MSETPVSFHKIMAQMVLVMTDDVFKDRNWCKIAWVINEFAKRLLILI